MSNVTLSLTMECTEEFFAAVIGKFMEWPSVKDTRYTAPENMIHLLTYGDEETVQPRGMLGAALVKAVLEAHPTIAHDHARLQELEDDWQVWRNARITKNEQFYDENLRARVREYVGIQLRYSPKNENWKESAMALE
ncbi:MAG TPA: hypothetical protein VLG69_04100 [Candidatus Andersenbacteria bacterium]|nr:hypothetical protein [Candidatus Andersenbacteria bacterium]